MRGRTALSAIRCYSAYGLPPDRRRRLTPPNTAQFIETITGMLISCGVNVGSRWGSKFGAYLQLSARVVVATVRGDEHGDGRPAIGFDFVVVLCSRLIEACDKQEIGSFEKRGEQAGRPQTIGHVQKRLRVQLTQQGLDLGDDIGGAGFVMDLA